MPIDVNWDEETDRRIIHFRQVGIWTWDEYDAGVDTTIGMMQSVTHPVTILIDLEEALSPNRTTDGFRHFMDAMKRWQATANYGRFWMVLKPNYWEHLALWMVSQVYNPYDMVVAKSLEDARRKALHLLKTKTLTDSDEIPDTP
jgi:hypothetical protein